MGQILISFLRRSSWSTMCPAGSNQFFSGLPHSPKCKLSYGPYHSVLYYNSLQCPLESYCLSAPNPSFNSELWDAGRAAALQATSLLCQLLLGRLSKQGTTEGDRKARGRRRDCSVPLASCFPQLWASGSRNSVQLQQLKPVCSFPQISRTRLTMPMSETAAKKHCLL